MSTLVQYEEDLNKCSDLLENIIKTNEDILSSLSVDIQFTQVNAQAVGMAAFFWIKTSKNEGAIKSNIYGTIYNVFSTNNIEFAISKQEIQIVKTTLSSKKDGQNKN